MNKCFAKQNLIMILKKLNPQMSKIGTENKVVDKDVFSNS